MPAPRVVRFTLSSGSGPTWINPRYVACVDVRREEGFEGHTWVQMCWGMEISVACSAEVALERLFPGMNVEHKG